MIYKNILPSLLVIFLIIFPTCSVTAVQSGNVEYNAAVKLFDYTTLDKTPVINDADMYFDIALNIKDHEEKKRFINLALGKYFLASKIAPDEPRTYVQLARLYDEMQKDTLAKSYFFHACNLETNDPYTNFWFGEFYFKRKDFRKALMYYNKAYNNGYADNYTLNLRLAEIYEKFADLSNALKFYGTTYSLNQQDAKLREKIQAIGDLNYESSEYYNSIRE